VICHSLAYIGCLAGLCLDPITDLLSPSSGRVVVTTHRVTSLGYRRTSRPLPPAGPGTHRSPGVSSPVSRSRVTRVPAGARRDRATFSWPEPVS
jgi:hypothetical protein